MPWLGKPPLYPCRAKVLSRAVIISGAKRELGKDEALALAAGVSGGLRDDGRVRRWGATDDAIEHGKPSAGRLAISQRRGSSGSYKALQRLLERLAADFLAGMSIRNAVTL